jgi:hypothetical protein
MWVDQKYAKFFTKEYVFNIIDELSQIGVLIECGHLKY